MWLGGRESFRQLREREDLAEPGVSGSQPATISVTTKPATPLALQSSRHTEKQVGLSAHPSRTDCIPGRIMPTRWLVRVHLPTRAQRRWGVVLPSWTFPTRKARVHAFILAVMLWVAAVVIAFAGSTNRSIGGPMKAADFVHFYTTGHLVRTGQSALLYDFIKQHEVQGELVPEAADLIYLPVYPPQTAIVFAPLSMFTYGHAALLWVALTIFCYAAVVWVAWRPVSLQLSDTVFVAAAAAAFPPFWQLVLHGQTTAIVLVAFCLGWLALDRRHAFLAGCAFGLIAMKPQFGLALAVATLARRDWPIVLGAMASVAVQALIVYWFLDGTVFHDFLQMARVAAERSDLLDPKTFQSHSLFSIARLAPAWVATPLWLAASAIVLWWVARVWRLDAPLRLRLSVVIIASVLVNPHLIVYDATLLALPLIWVSAAVREMRRPDEASWTWLAIYGLFAAFFAPTAAVISLQLSVVLMVYVFVQAIRVSYESLPATALVVPLVPALK